MNGKSESKGLRSLGQASPAGEKRPEGRVSGSNSGPQNASLIQILKTQIQKGRQLPAPDVKPGSGGTLQEGQEAVIGRAGSIAGTISDGLRAIQRGQGQTPQTRSSKSDNVVAQGDQRRVAGVGADSSVGPRSALRDVTLFKNSAQGIKPVQVIKRVAANETLALGKGVSLATGSSYVGSVMREREYAGRGGRHIQVVGHQFLTQLTSHSTDDGSPPSSIGMRLRGGMILISPQALGGRLQLLAQQFEECKVNRLRIHYCSLVAATEPGAVACYMRNDTATPTQDVGLDELMHASTHPSFRQSNVWQSFSMEIAPTDVQSKYWDEPSNAARQSFQGVLQFLAASALADDVPLGNVYVEFDIDFFGEELSYETKDVPTSVIVGSFNLADDSALEGVPIPWYFQSGAPGAGLCQLLMASPPDSVRYVGYGVVSRLNAAASVLSFCTQEDSTPRAMAVGQGFWITMGELPSSNSWTNSTRFALMSIDAESAFAANANSAYWNEPTSTPGIVCFSGTNASVILGDFSLDCRFVALDNTAQ